MTLIAQDPTEWMSELSQQVDGPNSPSQNFRLLKILDSLLFWRLCHYMYLYIRILI